MPKGNAQLTSRETLSLGIRRCRYCTCVAHLRRSRGIVGGHRPPRPCQQRARPPEGCRPRSMAPTPSSTAPTPGGPERPWPRYLGPRSVDAGGGWFIFALPPAELAVHPPDAGGRAVCSCCATTCRHRGSQAEGSSMASVSSAPGRVKLGHSVCASV